MFSVDHHEVPFEHYNLNLFCDEEGCNVSDVITEETREATYDTAMKTKKWTLDIENEKCQCPKHDQEEEHVDEPDRHGDG